MRVHFSAHGTLPGSLTIDEKQKTTHPESKHEEQNPTMMLTIPMITVDRKFRTMNFCIRQIKSRVTQRDIHSNH